jgi:hypothetical protein
MRVGTINKAAEEAHRFLEALERLKPADSNARWKDKHPEEYPCTCKESGSLRRASLDLTRALAGNEKAVILALLKDRRR